MSSSYLALLESLRVAYNLPALTEPLPSNQFHLHLENGLTVSLDFHPETDLVELFCPIGTYDPKDELEVLRKIAQANFLWAATAGGTLSARLNIQTVYLAYQAPLISFQGKQEKEFVTLVEKFADIAGQWQIILGTLSKEKSEATVS